MKKMNGLLTREKKKEIEPGADWQEPDASRLRIEILDATTLSPFACACMNRNREKDRCPGKIGRYPIREGGFFSAAPARPLLRFSFRLALDGESAPPFESRSLKSGSPRERDSRVVARE